MKEIQTDRSSSICRKTSVGESMRPTQSAVWHISWADFCNQPTFEQYCGIRVVSMGQGCAVAEIFFSPLFSDFSGSAVHFGVTKFKPILRLPYTFAGVFREKKYLRTILNATTTNYISVQS